MNWKKKELLQCAMRSYHEYVRLRVVYMGNRIRELSRALLDYVNLTFVAQQTLTIEASLNTHGFPLLVTQMEGNLSTHTVFFSVHGKRYFQRIWGTIILAKLGLYVARRESVCKPGWWSHSFFQGLRELSFPFQTLAPGLWLSFKEDARAQKSIYSLQ